MTFSLKNYLLLSAVGATALCSCSNEDFDGLGADAEARMVEMTVTLAKGDVDDDMSGSRTTLEENGGDLTCLWEESDRVLIATADGTPAGVLSLRDGAGQATATFTGQVDANKISSATPNTYVYVHYFGTEVNPETVTTTYRHDFSTQPGTLESLSDYDYFRNTVNITLSGDVLTTNYTAKLSRVTAFGRFHLNFSDGAILTPDAQVTVTGSFLHTVGNFDLKDQCTFDVPSTNTITTAIDPANGDIWLTILPASAPKTTSLTFTVTVGETTYTGTLAERQWKANEYVRATLEDGTFAGIPVEMTPEKGGDDNGEVNEYGEPLNNPLAKWAKFNLTRDGAETNKFAAEGDNGALYQWGRNHGYIDNKGIFSNVETDDDFINFEDAFGAIEQPGGANTQRYLDFYAHYPTGEIVYPCTGGYQIDPAGIGYYITIPDQAKSYNSVQTLIEHKDKFFMDATQSALVKDMGAFKWYDTNPDYWLSSFGDGGNTWEQRADKCGYEQNNPCPEGWRLPTLDEFKAIAPQQSINNASSTLASALNNYSELRYSKETNVDYAIRWVYEEDHLLIQTLVVSSTFTKADLANIRWDKEENVVTREFPFTGAITTIGGYDGFANEYVGFPYHRGVPDMGVYSVCIISPGNNTNMALGGYWIDEKGYFFKFMAGERVGQKQGQLLITDAAPSWAYAIRPVRDEAK